MPTIRKAEISDALELAKTAEETFRATFGHDNSDEDMDLHCEANFGEAIQQAELTDPFILTLLSEDQGVVVGFTQLRWGEQEACVSGSAPGEIWRLYVVSAWHGLGVAQELMNAALREMVEHGCDAVWLGVWEHNPRAIAFYQKFGFTKVGDHPFYLGNDPQRDLVLALSLEESRG